MRQLHLRKSFTDLQACVMRNMEMALGGRWESDDLRVLIPIKQLMMETCQMM